jgi:hypothetical protein
VKKKIPRKNRQQHRILFPVSSVGEAEILLPLANSIARARQSLLIVMHLVVNPEPGKLSQEAALVSRSRQALNQYLAEHSYNIPEIQTLVRVASEVWEGIWESVAQEKIDMLILGWESKTLPQTVISEINNPGMLSPPCDVILVRPGSEFTSCTEWQDLQHILLPVRGGPHAALAMRIAQNLADLNPDAQITLLHATSHPSKEAEQQIYAQFGAALRSTNQFTRSLTVVGNVAESIIAEAVDHQAIVMGAPANPGQDSWLSELIHTVERQIHTTLVVVKEKIPGAETSAQIAAESQARRDRPLAFVVDKWFAENTFHSREFANLHTLLELKQSQGLTISLGLPALNEEKTVGNVITSIKTALMDDVPLLDEIVLIDSGSTDHTREIAEDLGIPVYIHQEILPQYGAFRGKGEALWKSLFVLKGDILAWIDTDIKNIHPRFVFGILGPLLHYPRIQYVKGFYRRPIRQGDQLIAGGGGRVTELTARPFINLFYPELSGIIQPLSGEYAGRRTIFEQMPFFTGYGVETGLLLDILNQTGLQSIAQVDLLERIHHNQPLPSLSKMSFTIIQVFMSRLEKRHQTRILEEANLTMNLPRYSPNRFFLETEELIEQERPPMVSLVEYRDQFNKPTPEVAENIP